LHFVIIFQYKVLAPPPKRFGNHIFWSR